MEMEPGEEHYLFRAVVVALLWQSLAEAQITNGLGEHDNSKATLGVALSCVFLVFLIFIFIILFHLHMRHCSHYSVGKRNREVIDKCPVFAYSAVRERRMGNGATECAVCLIEFEDRDTIKMLPKCEHVFHRHCIDAWLPSRMNCPICRQKLTPETVVETKSEVVTVTTAEQRHTVVGPEEVHST